MFTQHKQILFCSYWITMLVIRSWLLKNMNVKHQTDILWYYGFVYTCGQYQNCQTNTFALFHLILEMQALETKQHFQNRRLYFFQNFFSCIFEKCWCLKRTHDLKLIFNLYIFQRYLCINIIYSYHEQHISYFFIFS